MQISSLKDDTLIIKNKNQKSYIYIHLNDICTMDTLTNSITSLNTNLLEENLDQKQRENLAVF